MKISLLAAALLSIAAAVFAAEGPAAVYYFEQGHRIEVGAERLDAMTSAEAGVLAGRVDSTYSQLKTLPSPEVARDYAVENARALTAAANRTRSIPLPQASAFEDLQALTAATQDAVAKNAEASKKSAALWQAAKDLAEKAKVYCAVFSCHSDGWR